ncbi:hypothetical protein [Photobacterium atrarenae]|uniref:Uncharacterized protein n=1 Tax=Photobacterium atrarenae TaxID=865757 RepID=A0ABY5GIW2_9GAMM|nr:hypothetical protein [Photobacterium atrarenae]UTV29071.1 hypothetical protein NNL38_07545 [Photobacterium atrarenae]
MTTAYQSIDVPFEFRHTCWFCGEPYFESYAFMPSPNYEHQAAPVLLPCCEECYGFCRTIKVSGLDLLRDKVKEKLHRKYEKHLQIGANWTQEELAASEFEGKALEGFKESAWTMFEIAKERVNYAGWPLTIDGLPIAGLTSRFQIEFDGIVYTSLAHAIEQLAKTYVIPQPYLEQVVEVVGRQRLGYAIRFAKTTYGYSDEERAASIVSLKNLLAEESELAPQNAASTGGMVVDLAEIQSLIIARIQVMPQAIHWALTHGVTTLHQLAEQEEAFFEYFMPESELVAFTYFNGLQVYFEKRENEPEWAASQDPNRALFARLTD